MIPEFGDYAIVLALVLALVQGIVPLAGAARNHPSWMALARPLAYGQFGFLLLAFGVLGYCFVVNDFTVKYVADTSNTLLPLHYKLSAIWGGHEGSLLLWALTLAGWTAAVALWSRTLPLPVVARVLGIMGLVAVGFISFLLFTSNPFDRLLPDFPPDGADLNPLLQDPGLIIHPPMLYMGYVGFSVAFAFAVAGLLGGRLDSAWARWSRPWTTVAWCFLTLGIALGSWWAYYELGWGGWWFWDPVENASFMPWLAGTALMHSLAATEKRAVFKSWTVLLAILTFSLSLLGTFLVRSGVLTSVHSFAADPQRGLFVLVLLAIAVGGSLTLFAIRAPTLQTQSRFRLLSRETLLLGNNFFLILAMTIVLVGTVSPIIYKVLTDNNISIGEPFFNRYFSLVAIPLLVMTALGSRVNWKGHERAKLIGPVIVAALVASSLTAILMWWAGLRFEPIAYIVFSLAVWLVWHTLADASRKVRTARAGWWAGVKRLPRSYRGMMLGHIGLAISVAGVTMVSFYDVERDVRMSAGDRAEIGPYQFEFAGVREVQGPNYVATRGEVRVAKDGEVIAVLHPEKRRYVVRQQMMTEAAIDAGLFRDLYVALGEPIGDGSWAVRLYYKPWMRWVWGGGVVMAWGGALALADRRYRLKLRSRRQSKAQPAENTEVAAV